MTRVTTCVLLCAVALLSGCRLDADVDVAVDGDGGGTFAVTVAADEELLADAADAGANPLAALGEAGAQLDGWEVTRGAGESDDGTGEPGAGGGAAVTLATRFRDAAELHRVTTDFADGLGAPELAPLEPLRLTVTDDTVALAGAAALRPTAQVSELGLTRAQADRLLADTARMRVVVRMPGQILQTDADQRPDGTTAVWTLAAGQHRRLAVTSARPWSLARVVAVVGGPRVAAAAALALATGIGLAVWLLLRRRVRGGG